MTRVPRGVAVVGAVLGCASALAGGVAAPASALPPKVLELGFDEGYGTVARDSSGAGNHGGLSAGVRWTQAGRFGLAVAFDGDDRVTVPDAPSLDLGPSGYTIMAWVRPRRLDGWQTVVMKDNVIPPYADPTIPYGLYATTGDGEPPRLFSGTTDVAGPASVARNGWTHLAGTYDGTTYRLYVDGVCVGSQTGPPPVTTQLPLGIGDNAIWPRIEGFDGLIDEVRAYAGPLSGAEIAAARETPIGDGSKDVAQPVAALAFDEGSGNRAHDSGVFGHNLGTVSGARWTTTARWGRALMFDGVDDAVVVADDDALDLRDELTISAWVRPRSRGQIQAIVAKESPWAFSYMLASFDEADDGADELTGLFSSSHGNERVSGPVLPLNAWSHVAYTFDGTVTRLYVNGDQVAQGAGSPPEATDGPLRIGSWSKYPSAFDGVIDEVRLYDKALPVDQIRRDRDTSIVPDAVAAWRNPGDGSAEPSGLGVPPGGALPVPAGARATGEGEGGRVEGAPVTAAASAPTPAPSPSPRGAVAAGTDARASQATVQATRSGDRVTVAVRGAQRGRISVTLRSRTGRRAGACTARVTAGGRATCRITLARGVRTLRSLRATVTLRPSGGAAHRVVAPVALRKAQR